jgi:hypothetical protein
VVFASAVTATLNAQGLSPLDVVADAGVTDGGATSERAPGDPNATWFAGVTAETARLPMPHRWDFSADGAIRREPALAMVHNGAAIVPAYLDAIASSATIRFAHALGSIETAIVARLAGTRLDRDQRLTSADNTIGNWTFFADAVGELRWYGRSGRALSDGHPPAPLVSVYAGVKHDQRFHRAGDLSNFDDPTGRLEGGFFIAPWRLANGDGAHVMSAGGGVDAETALDGRQRLPSAFRVFLSMEVDLRDAFGRR